MRKDNVPHLSVVELITEVKTPHDAGRRVREALDELLAKDPEHLDPLDLETIQRLLDVVQGTLARRRAKGVAVVKIWFAEHEDRKAIQDTDVDDLRARLAFATGDSRFATGSLEPATLQQVRGDTGANAPQAVGVFAWLCFAHRALVDGLGENTASNRKDFAKELRKEKVK